MHARRASNCHLCLAMSRFSASMIQRCSLIASSASCRFLPASSPLILAVQIFDNSRSSKHRVPSDVFSSYLDNAFMDIVSSKVGDLLTSLVFRKLRGKQIRRTNETRHGRQTSVCRPCYMLQTVACARLPYPAITTSRAALCACGARTSTATACDEASATPKAGLNL